MIGRHRDERTNLEGIRNQKLNVVSEAGFGKCFGVTGRFGVSHGSQRSTGAKRLNGYRVLRSEFPEPA